MSLDVDDCKARVRAREREREREFVVETNACRNRYGDIRLAAGAGQPCVGAEAFNDRGLIEPWILRLSAAFAPR